MIKLRIVNSKNLKVIARHLNKASPLYQDLQNSQQITRFYKLINDSIAVRETGTYENSAAEKVKNFFLRAQ